VDGLNKKNRIFRCGLNFSFVGAARFELATFPISYRDANIVHKKNRINHDTA